MTGLGDALNEAFEADAGRQVSLDASRIIGAIRRRRAARSAGMGTAAAVGIGAVGAVWWLVPGGRLGSTVQPGASVSCNATDFYLPPNPESLGDFQLRFRAYIDLRANAPHRGVVAVTPDGAVTQVEANEAGDYVFDGTVVAARESAQSIVQEPMVIDFDADSGAGEAWDGVTPFVKDYEWTTVVPSDVPEGVDTEALSSVLRPLTGIGGLSYSATAVPAGANTDAIVTTTIGTTEYPLADGDSLPTLAFTENVVSVALRVRLAEGGTFTVTTTHHEVDPDLLACGPGPTATSAGTPSPAPTETLPGSSPEPTVSASTVPAVTAALQGPEAAVFACGAPLSEELEGTLGLDVRWQSGSVPATLPGLDPFEFGDGGVLVTGELEKALSADKSSPGMGWARAWNASGQEVLGVGLFTWVAAAKDGEIVGVAAANPGDERGRWPQDSVGIADTGSITGTVYSALVEPAERLVPCDGFDAEDLEDSEMVLLLGAGLDDDSYQFAWTPIEPS